MWLFFLHSLMKKFAKYCESSIASAEWGSSWMGYHPTSNFAACLLTKLDWVFFFGCCFNWRDTTHPRVTPFKDIAFWMKLDSVNRQLNSFKNRGKLSSLPEKPQSVHAYLQLSSKKIKRVHEVAHQTYRSTFDAITANVCERRVLDRNFSEGTPS